MFCCVFPQVWTGICRLLLIDFVCFRTMVNDCGEPGAWNGAARELCEPDAA